MEKRDTKQVILDEALELFSTSGFDGVTVADIADAVGIKGRFYIMRTVQKMIHRDLQKKGQPETRDHIHWKRNGWLDGKKPWKNEDSHRL